METWIKTQWCGDGAEFTLTPDGSIVIDKYVSQSGLTGKSRVITPAWTYTSKYRQVWRYYKDAARAAWREGVAWYAAPEDKWRHPSEWDGDVVAYARTITRESLEEALHFSEPVRGSKPIENWKMFWAWTTRPASHPRAWPIVAVAPEFAHKLLASESTGQFYELPAGWGKVFPLKSGPSVYWDGHEEFNLVSRNCPDEVLGSLLSPDIAAKRRRWEL